MVAVMQCALMLRDPHTKFGTEIGTVKIDSDMLETLLGRYRPGAPTWGPLFDIEVSAHFRPDTKENVIVVDRPEHVLAIKRGDVIGLEVVAFNPGVFLAAAEQNKSWAGDW